jgi:oligoendopeptidase F
LDLYELWAFSLDNEVWQWMYDHPNATANDLKEAVIELSKEIWNEYYAPVFGIKDQTILAIYSHSIDAPLYLSAYPLGYLIHYQLNNHFKGKDFGTEVARIIALGSLTPLFWLKKAVGMIVLSPVLSGRRSAVEQVANKPKSFLFI